MSNFELSDIAGELVRLALYDTIKTLTNSVVDRVKIVPKVLAENGCGIVCRVTFTATNGSSSPLSSSLILKVAAQNLMRRSYTYARPCFLREIFVYDEVSNCISTVTNVIPSFDQAIRNFFFANSRFYHISVSLSNRKASMWMQMVLMHIHSATEHWIPIKMSAFCWKTWINVVSQCWTAAPEKQRSIMFVYLWIVWPNFTQFHSQLPISSQRNSSSSRRI